LSDNSDDNNNGSGSSLIKCPLLLTHYLCTRQGHRESWVQVLIRGWEPTSGSSWGSWKP